MKKLHFIAGLPRSGTTMITNLLRQNPKIHGEPVSSLVTVFNAIYMNWDHIEENKEYPNEQAKRDVLLSVLEGYHRSSNKEIVFDKDRLWVSRIALLESIMQRKVKIMCCVRQPVEILASFEKIRKDNPTVATLSDFTLQEKTTIGGRAHFFAGPDGALGQAVAMIKDAITMGYRDRLLFVDYDRFCNDPRLQMKRIYDFFELPSFQHDFQKIEQTEKYSYVSNHLPDLHKIKPTLDKTHVNCVEYLGSDLYQKYSTPIFWNEWI